MDAPGDTRDIIGREIGHKGHPGSKTLKGHKGHKRHKGPWAHRGPWARRKRAADIAPTCFCFFVWGGRALKASERGPTYQYINPGPPGDAQVATAQ